MQDMDVKPSDVYTFLSLKKRLPSGHIDLQDSLLYSSLGTGYFVLTSTTVEKKVATSPISDNLSGVRALARFFLPSPSHHKHWLTSVPGSILS
ncbi:hypothetical protein GNF82_17210, partial [Clostridium perfringens]